MLKYWAYIFVSFFCVLSTVEGANILAIFPYPSPGQYIVVQPLLKELARRGHDVTVISHNFYTHATSTPYRDTPIKRHFDEIIAANLRENQRVQRKMLSQYHRNVTLSVLQHIQVDQLMFGHNYKFDMVIVDTLIPSAIYAIATHFKAHLVGVSSSSTEPHIDNMVGNESPVSSIPMSISGIYRPLTLLERNTNICQAILEWLWIYTKEWIMQRDIYTAIFPHLTTSLDEICRNFSLVLLNQHFSIELGRPYVPNMIEVGGMYISEDPGPLPADVLQFINGAKHGVIYVSMGTHLKFHTFPKQIFEAFLNFFYHSKFRFLWRFENPGMKGIPSNVLARKWFPQRAVLAHPMVVAFVTHGGFLSVMEAIYFGKPVVAVPVFCDHYVNTKRIYYFRTGRIVPFVYLTAERLTYNLDKVLTNIYYKHNVLLMQRRFRDRPTKTLETAVFWTEYILRHKGAHFMRVPVKDMNTLQYYNVDVIIFVLVATIILTYLNIKFYKLCTNFVNYINTRHEREARRKEKEQRESRYD